MRVLVVEDDEDKLEVLVDYLQGNYDVEHVATAKSLQSGLLAALRDDVDLLILDMTMTNFDRTVTDEGGRPHAFAGREILRQMKRDEVKTPVIIVTHFDRFGEEKDFTTLDQLKDELRDKFPNYVGTVQYRGNVDEWKLLLGEYIDRTVLGAG